MLETIGIVIIFLIAAYWSTYIRRTTKKGAPFVPLEAEVVEEVMRLAEIKNDDICFAGLHGNDMKLRVKKLEVLD